MKNEIICILISIMLIIIFIIFLEYREVEYNKKEHSDDVIITEWISPDGVHYWYQQSGYHAMLAPRYDVSGNLVIDEVK